jgi:hypothetical protein
VNLQAAWQQVVEFRAVLLAWVTARILLFAAWVTAAATSDKLIDDRVQTIKEGLFAWDGTFYRAIAQDGYDGVDQEALRFFPLYPLLARLLSPLALGREDVMLIVIANVCALGAGVMLRRYVLQLGHPKATADLAVWLLMLSPAAFVLVMGYTEALFILVCLVAFVAARNSAWRWVFIAGFAAGATRPVGLALSVPLLLLALPGWRALAPRQLVARGAAIISPFIGSLAYLAWVEWKYDDGWLPIDVQQDLRGGFVFPLVRLFQAVGDAFGDERLGDGLHMPFAVAMVALVVLAFWRLPLADALFAALLVLTALAAENLNSIERYGLAAFPLIVVLAVEARRFKLEQAVLVITAATMSTLGALAFAGAYVP